uniref:BLOC-1-related complex subunit 8-like isoform X1 n=1 Tax=Myxine glutinosa TaxID=7769 RepID=UPI00358EFFFF
MDDPEIHQKAKKVTDRVTEMVLVLAQEPSVGLFRLQEHILKSLPDLVDLKVSFQEIYKKCNGVVYDVEYTTSPLQGIERSSTVFGNVESLLRQAIDASNQRRADPLLPQSSEPAVESQRCSQADI